MKKTVDAIITDLIDKKGFSKAQLGRAVGVATDGNPSKATDIINKRMKQKNISVKLLSEMLAPLGYTIAIVPVGQKRNDDEYEVDING